MDFNKLSVRIVLTFLMALPVGLIVGLVTRSWIDCWVTIGSAVVSMTVLTLLDRIGERQ
mgnify:CR=1 FL=1